MSTKLKEIFPNAKIINIYASTEVGTLLISHNEIYEIPNDLREFIKINEDSELIVHSSLLANLENFNGEWYNTKDKVKKIDENKFKFIGRSNEGINVAGYVVYPNEVEEIINELDEIDDCRIYCKGNKLIGNLLCIDVKVNDRYHSLDVKFIKQKIMEHLMGRVQKWKIPRIYKLVNEIPKTRTGKKVRK